MPAPLHPCDVTLVAGDFVQTGGMDRANYALADYLAGSGRRVELVAHRVAPELTARAEVVFTRVPKPFDSYTLGEPFLDRVGGRAARARLTGGGGALVNGGNAVAPCVNWVHYVHAAYQPLERLSARGVRRRLFHLQALRRERAALRVATTVIANSAATKRVLVERLGVPSERVKIVYYGIDAERFSATTAESAADARARLGFSPRPLVAFIGALGDRRKGFDTLFEAWRQLCGQSTWDADLIVIGAGSELPRFRARAAAIGIEQRVRLLGFRSDVDQLLGACDALIAPTRYEAFGLGVAEALARGLPAIVSAAAGVAELYPDELRHLLIDDPDSVSELSRRLLVWREGIVEQRARVQTLSETVRARSWETMASEIARELEI